MPGFGSWEWIGAALCQELSDDFTTLTFQETVPECDIVIYVKFHPPLIKFDNNEKRPAVVFCPIDFYGTGQEIDADAPFLFSCNEIIVHSESLTKYFRPYAKTTVLDHHLKYVTPEIKTFQSDGPIFWTGVRTNLQPLVRWVNAHDLPEELWVLTNLEDSAQSVLPDAFGFNNRNTIRVENWSPQLHLEWLSLARAGIDIKGSDFRSRHKPPTKACDAIASGLPLAMNKDSYATEYFLQRKFELANPEDADYWLSRDYWEKTYRQAVDLRQSHSLPAIGKRVSSSITSILDLESHYSQHIH